MNYRYTPEVYKALLIDSVYTHQVTLKVEELKNLYQELATDIQFISQYTILYYNRKYSVGPELKEGDKVYLLRKNIRTKRPSNKLDHKKLGLFKIKKKIRSINYRL